MTAYVRALDIAGNARDVSVYVNQNGGRLLTETDRGGGGWHTVGVSLLGRNGGSQAWLSLSPGQARALAAALSLSAEWTDARARGRPGPCLCNAWGHTPLSPCPQPAADDYTMCRECWTPETGQSEIAAYHGVPKRAPHPFRHPSTARNGACLDCGEHEEDGPHTAAPLPAYRIAGPLDPLDGEPLYWSNADGWVSRGTADVYATKDGNLPMEGRWVDITD